LCRGGCPRMGVCTMRLPSLLLLVMILGLCQAGSAQSPTYGLGKTPSAEEIRAWDIAISPTGKELPPGSGSAKEGAPLYAQKCAACHGATGYGGRAPQLIRTESTTPPPAGKAPPCLSPCIRNETVMGIYSPYATTIWDYINRGMPFGKEGTLTPNEVYALKCAACHGATGYGGRAPQLIRTESTTPPPAGKAPPCLSPCIRNETVMGIYSPYATTIWDYINRGMPFGKEGTLTPNEVYA